jgi:hypothetical protein
LTRTELAVANRIALPTSAPDPGLTFVDRAKARSYRAELGSSTAQLNLLIRKSGKRWKVAILNVNQPSKRVWSTVTDSFEKATLVAEGAAARVAPTVTPIIWRVTDDNDRQTADQGKLVWLTPRLLGALLGLFAALAGISLSDPLLSVNNAKPSDAILVLGGDEDALRYQKALSLLAAGYGHQMVVDADGASTWWGATEADLVERYASATANVSVCPVTATSTRTETADANRCLSKLGAKRVLIVTSRSHTRRALSVFSELLPQYEWSVAGVKPPPQFSAWLAMRKDIMREWCKFFYWELVTRWKRPGVEARNTNKAATLLP